jgi:hypothetical protein
LQQHFYHAINLQEKNKSRIDYDIDAQNNRLILMEQITLEFRKFPIKKIIKHLREIFPFTILFAFFHIFQLFHLILFSRQRMDGRHHWLVEQLLQDHHLRGHPTFGCLWSMQWSLRRRPAPVLVC